MRCVRPQWAIRMGVPNKTVLQSSVESLRRTSARPTASTLLAESNPGTPTWTSRSPPTPITSRIGHSWLIFHPRFLSGHGSAALVSQRFDGRNRVAGVALGEMFIERRGVTYNHLRKRSGHGCRLYRARPMRANGQPCRPMSAYSQFPSSMPNRPKF